MSGPCTRYLESMSAFIDGELPEAEARALEAHLAECSDCRLAFEEMRAADEKLRAATAHASDSRSEVEALERALARLRDEPAPEWDAARRSRWNWSVTLRWSAGLAAAAAAVLLVMRLGPTPTAPIRMRVIPPSHEAVSSAPAAPTPAPQVGERTQEVAKRKQEPPVPARTTRAARDQRAPVPVEPKTEQEPEQEPAPKPEATPQTAVQEAPQRTHPNSEETKASAPTANIGTDLVQRDQERSGADESSRDAPAPPPTRPESRGERPASPERGAASAERAPAPSPPQKDGSILGRVKSTLSGGAVRTLDQPSRGYFSETGPAQPWYMTVAEGDTTIADRDWKARLEDAEAEMMSLESAKLRGDERARRYHAIGDLWEWFGRTANDPIADVHALTCYRLAVRNDAQAAALDSTRVQRARAAVAGEVKVKPANR